MVVCLVFFVRWLAYDVWRLSFGVRCRRRPDSALCPADKQTATVERTTTDRRPTTGRRSRPGKRAAMRRAGFGESRCKDTKRQAERENPGRKKMAAAGRRNAPYMRQIPCAMDVSCIYPARWMFHTPRGMAECASNATRGNDRQRPNPAHEAKVEITNGILLIASKMPFALHGWRWRESNPRPNREPESFLHVYPSVDPSPCAWPTAAERRAQSLEFRPRIGTLRALSPNE